MRRLALLALLIIHGCYTFKHILLSFIPARKPKPLLARRRRIPGHLALILIPDAENHDAREEESVMQECVEQVVDWCKEVGVQRLSVYERDGVLSRNSRYVSSVARTDSLRSLEEVDFQDPKGPPTPPASDADPNSRPRSPDVEFCSRATAVTTIQIPYLACNEGSEKKFRRRGRQSHLFESKPRRQSLTFHILSRESSKPAIAAAARWLVVSNESQRPKGKFSLSVSSLGHLLEGEGGFPSPDLVIVHPLHPSTSPLELQGFPPWQIRLSEMYYAPRRPRIVRSRDMGSRALSEVEFRCALDEYCEAEMRLGK